MELPSFLTPDFGLLFWMLLAFCIVLFVLAKFGFPAILGMVEERKRYIDESISSAREANEKLANIKLERNEILKEAKQTQSQILKDATATRDRIIREAKEKAASEAARIVEEGRQQIETERRKAQAENRDQIVNLSVQIASCILSRNLSTDEQQLALINQTLNELTEAK